MKKILHISTGGTIAQQKNPDGIAVPADHDNLIHNKLNDLATKYGISAQIDSIAVLNKDSSNIIPSDWKIIIDTIVEKYDDYDAFIITHGTNTLGYTAAALSFAFGKIGKRLILTGSQVSYGYIGSDAEMNMANSIRMATYEKHHIAGVFAVRDLGELLLTYAKFFGSFMVGISTLWIVLLLVGFVFLKSKMKTLLSHIISPLIIAFGTTSSEAVFPKLTEELERFGIKDRIVSFMLPLGYSFNLDGSMMYMTFASIFIAQAYDVPLDTGTQFTMLFVLMLTSKGIAGVPRASLVVVAATCGMFKIPVEGIALILPIDHFCDMFRSATNVLGNALATSVVGKWEKDS